MTFIQLEFLPHTQNKNEVLVVLPQLDSNAAKIIKSKVITDMAYISALLFWEITPTSLNYIVSLINRIYTVWEGF